MDAGIDRTAATLRSGADRQEHALSASPEPSLAAGPPVAPNRDDGAKRRQIIDGARRVFLSTGFDGASMNEVARAAGVSKGTLYVYFASKEELFAALLRQEKSEQAEQMCRFDEDGPDLAADLRAFGAAFVALVLRPDSLAHMRTVMAVAPKFPEIGRAYHEAGPETGRRRLAHYLERQAAAGRLRLDDAEEAAQHFFELCKSRMFLEALLCLRGTPTQAEAEAQANRATALFLRLYGA